MANDDKPAPLTMAERTYPPKIDNAPGLVWKPRLAGWEARWQARTDLVQRGYMPKSLRLWKGRDPDEFAVDYIRARCRAYQDKMLLWGQGGERLVAKFDGTVRGLIACYETDPDSPYRKLRYRTRENYGFLTRRIMKDCGEVDLASVNGRMILRWHEGWSADGKKVAMGHSVMGMLRALVSFGVTLLEDEHCNRIAVVLHKMRFSMAKPRSEALTAAQAAAIIAKAHEVGLHSIALGQAFQFDCMLRQRDVIGEWVPVTEDVAGISEVYGNEKWVRGIRWEEIDANLVLHHVTSKRGKLTEPPLRFAPLVMAELARMGQRPASGPIIVSEINRVPWTPYEYRRQWRKIARSVGIPDTVKNMDSRAGGITEATDAGASLEQTRHAATHSNTSTTAGYSRNSSGKTAEVMQLRAEHRNKTGTNEQ